MKVRLVLSPLPSPSPTWPPVTLFTPSPTWPSATLLTPGLFPQPHVALSDPTHPRCSRVLMLKPSVGEMVSTSSPLNFLRMVVLPALSKPLGHIG